MPGGNRKRFRAADAGEFDERVADIGHGEDLPLNQTMKRMWAKGELSSPQVQELAAGALKQGARGTNSFAKIGTSGTRPGNMFRDLVQAFGYPAGAPPLFWANVPTASGIVAHPFMLPHLFFGHLNKNNKEQFLKSVLGMDTDCEFFWSSEEGRKLAEQHPELKHRSPAQLRKTVPLGLHGDGGAYSHQDSLYAVSWNSFVGLGITITKRFIFTLIRKAKLTPATWVVIWQIFGWSVNALLTGQTPSSDWQGRPLEAGGAPIADGFSGALIQIRGDWAFYCEVLHFPKHNEVENMCWMCKAAIKIPEYVYTNATATAGWRTTMRSHESYSAELLANDVPLPGLFAHVVGLRLEHVAIDVLHTVDLGVASHVIANTMVEVMKLGQWGRTYGEQVTGLSADLKSWYRRSGSSLHKLKGKLTIDRLRSKGGWPKLKAKASATRHMAHYCLDIATRFNDGSVHDRRRLSLSTL